MEDLPTVKIATNSLIDEALRRCNNNQKKASKILGITRQALNKRLTRREETFSNLITIHKQKITI